MSNERSVMAIIRAARPSFRNDHDKIAFAVHASFLSSGFFLTATGRDALGDNVLYSPSTDEVGTDNWNEFEDHYAFVYTNPEKGSNKVLVKCLVMYGKFLVDALASGSSEPVHLEIDIDTYVGENGSGNYSAKYKNLEKLVSSLDKDVISLLYGSSSKSSSSSNPASLETGEGSRRDINDAGVRINEPLGPHFHPLGVIIPPINLVRGSVAFPGPPAGMYPTSGVFGGGYMLVGPNDPRWYGGVGGEHGFPGAQPGVPPGARFDTFSPAGGAGFEPNRFVRNPPRRPGDGRY